MKYKNIKNIGHEQKVNSIKSNNLNHIVSLRSIYKVNLRSREIQYHYFFRKDFLMSNVYYQQVKSTFLCHVYIGIRQEGEPRILKMLSNRRIQTQMKACNIRTILQEEVSKK